MCMLIHNGSRDNDFDFSWVDSKTSKIRVKWQSVMMMKSLDMTTGMGGDEYETYPSNHKLYDSMGENAAAIKREDGTDGTDCIWTQGLFHFANHMNTDNLRNNSL